MEGTIEGTVGAANVGWDMKGCAACVGWRGVGEQ
jgi:hypothetical protein